MRCLLFFFLRSVCSSTECAHTRLYKRHYPLKIARLRVNIRIGAFPREKTIQLHGGRAMRVNNSCWPWNPTAPVMVWST